MLKRKSHQNHCCLFGLCQCLTINKYVCYKRGWRYDMKVTLHKSPNIIIVSIEFDEYGFILLMLRCSSKSYTKSCLR